jgi:hypothetical protein
MAFPRFIWHHMPVRDPRQHRPGRRTTQAAQHAGDTARRRLEHHRPAASDPDGLEIPTADCSASTAAFVSHEK